MRICVASLPEAGECFGQKVPSSTAEDVHCGIPQDVKMVVRRSFILLENEVIGAFP
jgi:hypothetical protein